MSHLLNFVNTVEELKPFVKEGSHNTTGQATIDLSFYDLFADTGTAVLGYNMVIDNTELPPHIPHVVPLQFREEASTRLCEKFGWDKVFWSNSGTEAVEAMIKFARKATGRETIYVPDTGQFHGRTYGAMSISVQQENHINGYGPFMPGVKRFTQPEDIGRDAAAVVITPGLLNKVYEPYDKSWVSDVAEQADIVGAKLCVDEVQTFLRLGTWWGHELYDIHPDMICTAKGISGGYPSGVTLLRDDVADTLARGGHFSTFGAHPLACAGTMALLDMAESPKFFGHVETLGYAMEAKLRSHGYNNICRDGAMLQVILPERVDCPSLVRRCAENGLLIQIPKNRYLKLTPPLLYTEGDILKAMDILLYELEKYGGEIRYI